MRISINGKITYFEEPIIMGILNVTDDSFSDGGKYLKLGHAIDHAAKMIRYGASIIDVGGESTRPGSNCINDYQELERVIPVIMALSKRFDAFISIDTSKPLVLKESISAGVHILNDVYSLRKEGMLKILSKSKLAICLVHMQGEPFYMQNNPCYKNVIKDIKSFFKKKIKLCKSFGISEDRLLIDPGFGFGKTLKQNYSILAHLKEFSSFNLPILVGMSRKSMISSIKKYDYDNKCIIGSISCAVIAALNGAKIIRVHDVLQASEAINIIKHVLLAKKYFNY